jgi:hypothetical protein
MIQGFKLKQLLNDMNSLREELHKLVGTKGLVDEEVLTMSRDLDQRIVVYLRVLKEMSHS